MDGVYQEIRGSGPQEKKFIGDMLQEYHTNFSGKSYFPGRHNTFVQTSIHKHHGNGGEKMSLKLSTALKPQSSLNWIAIFYGTLLAVITSIILIAIGGTVMYYTVFNERFIPVIGLGILFVSVFLGGFVSSRKSGKMGLIHGLAVGILLLIITVLFNILLPGGIFGFPIFKKILASLVGGCLGGIWGVGQN